jgi:hypothetical protein
MLWLNKKNNPVKQPTIMGEHYPILAVNPPYRSL